MTSSLMWHRRFIVFATLFAMAVATTLVLASPTRAIHNNCENESAIVDAGGYYIVYGTSGNDSIDCSNADLPVEIRGGAGADTLIGSIYGDWLKGGWGDDDDSLYGGDGNDFLYGGWGYDSLFGQDGDDWIEGGQNGDFMNGGYDTDTCLGGRGDDSGIYCETLDLGKDEL